MSANETAEAIWIVIKRLFKWIFFIALLCFLGLLVAVLYPEVKQYFENRPKVINEIQGISLGEKYSDFMFRNSGFVAMKPESKRADGETHYENKSLSLRVGFKDSLIVNITYICKDTYEYTSVSGIKCNSRGDAIFEKYGKDVRVLCLKDKTDNLYQSYRVYDVVKYGLRHHVFSNVVKAFDVNTLSRISDNGANWTTCD
jgi:hypothetical protein